MSNPLLYSPFQVIPGVNPNDPISAQMEQLDLLNTILLQDIDENFAKFHQVITTKILPAVKRFSQASEPTREAAKFWKNFFEAAAEVPIIIPGGEGDQSLTSHSHEQDETATQSESTLHPSNSEEVSDDSFMNGVMGASSTPVASRGHQLHLDDLDSPSTPLDDEEPSWAESPFDRTNRLLEADIARDASLLGRSAGARSRTLEGGARGVVGTPDTAKGTGRQLKAGPSHSRHASSSSAIAGKKKSSKNPFQDQSNNGIVDIRTTPLVTSRYNTQPYDDNSSDSNLSDEDDDHGLYPKGWSPPVTMHFTAPHQGTNWVKTPAKDAAEAITRRFLKTIEGDSASNASLGSVPRNVSGGVAKSPSMASLGYASPRAYGNMRAAANSRADDDGDDGEDDGYDQSSRQGSVLDELLAQGVKIGDESFDSQDDSMDDSEADITLSPTTNAPAHLHQPPLSATSSISTAQYNLAGVQHSSLLQHSSQASGSTRPLIDLDTTADSLASVNESFDTGEGHGEKDTLFGPISAKLGGAGRAGGFGLLARSEMDTFMGGKLEDAGPTESPTPGLALGGGKR